MNPQSITINQFNTILIYNQCLGHKVKRKELKILTYAEAEMMINDLESRITDMIEDSNYEAYKESLLEDEYK